LLILFLIFEIFRRASDMYYVDNLVDS
jgi:hypothetical protein